MMSVLASKLAGHLRTSPPARAPLASLLSSGHSRPRGVRCKPGGQAPTRGAPEHCGRACKRRSAQSNVETVSLRKETGPPLSRKCNRRWSHPDSRKIKRKRAKRFRSSTIFAHLVNDLAKIVKVESACLRLSVGEARTQDLKNPHPPSPYFTGTRENAFSSILCWIT